MVLDGVMEFLCRWLSPEVIRNWNHSYLEIVCCVKRDFGLGSALTVGSRILRERASACTAGEGVV